MANRARTKVSRDVATDESSMDSLSFASLVCVHEQQKKLPPKAANQETNFEFCSVSLNSTKVYHQGRDQASILVSNSRTQHREFLQSKQPQAASPIQSGVLLQDYLGHKKSSYCKDGGIEKHPRKGNQKEQGTGKADNRASRSRNGQKIFVSFLAPCRECHARDPAIKKPKKVHKERPY